MHHAGLQDVWDMLQAIVARQTPFAQIMITVGVALFIVMAIEGMRTSVLAMRGAAREVGAKVPERTDVAPTAASEREGPAPRRYAVQQSPRPVARPVRKLRRRAAPVSFTKGG